MGMIFFQITWAIAWEGVFIFLAVQTLSQFYGSVVGKENLDGENLSD